MKLKFSNRWLNENHVIPFPDDTTYISGIGRIRKGVAVDGWVVHIYNSHRQEWQVRAHVDVVMSEMEEEQPVRFCTLYTDGNSVHKTYVWDEDEYSVYIMNDDGKTTDKL